MRYRVVFSPEAEDQSQLCITTSQPPLHRTNAARYTEAIIAYCEGCQHFRIAAPGATTFALACASSITASGQ